MTNDMATLPQSDNAALVAAGTRAMAEVQAAYTIAQARPRDLVKVRDAVQRACQVLELAEKAETVYARGGKDITIVTVHLLRAIARETGNLKWGFGEVRHSGTNGQPGFSEVRAYAIDLETNVEASTDFTVRHWRDTKAGGYQLTAERDIYEAVANQAARRTRKCLEEIVPGGLIDVGRDAARKTLKDSVKLTPEKIKKMIDTFGKEFAVTQEMIEKRIQRRAEAITASQYLGLRRIWQSMKDDMSQADDWFEQPKQDLPEAKPAPPTPSLSDEPIPAEDAQAELEGAAAAIVEDAPEDRERSGSTSVEAQQELLRRRSANAAAE